MYNKFMKSKKLNLGWESDGVVPCQEPEYEIDVIPQEQFNIQAPNQGQDEWCCHLFGSNGSNGMTLTPGLGGVPNFFHRWMMRIILGCKWEKRN